MTSLSDPWSGEAKIIMWFVNSHGDLCRHNFYHRSVNGDGAEARAQFYEYELGCVTWLEYVQTDRH